MKITLVVLTLNEIIGLQSIFHLIPLEGIDEVLVVDGGSTDGSIKFLEDLGVRVIVQEKRGRGEAFRLAFEKSKGDALIFFSPDGNEDPSDIPKFFNPLSSGADIVIANRMSEGGENEEDHLYFPLRKWANNIFTWVANIIWNKKKYVHDSINGFRAISRHAWNTLSLDGSGYTIEYQMSIRAFKYKMDIIEFPTIEGQRIDQRIGSPSFETGLAFLKLFFKELFTYPS